MRVRSSLLPPLGAVGTGLLLAASSAVAQPPVEGGGDPLLLGGALPPVRAEGGHRPQVRRDRDGNLVLRNRHLVAVLPKRGSTYGPLALYPNPRSGTEELRPIASARFFTTAAAASVEARVRGEWVELSPAGAQGNGAATVVLKIGDEPWIDWEARAEAGSPPEVTVAVLAGREGPRETLLPGVLYQDGTEAISSTPYTPDAYRVTVPAMALHQNRVTVGVLWKPTGSGGNRAGVLFHPRKESVRMEVSLPRGSAGTGQLRQSGKLLVLPDSSGPTDAARMWAEAFPLPEEIDYPRSFAAERRLSRQAFTDTLWSASAPGWKLSPDASEALPYPFGVQALWLDAGLEGNRRAAAELRRPADQVLGTLRERGPLDLALAYRAGGARESLDALRDRVLDLVAEQLPDGSWLPGPGTRPTGARGVLRPAEAGVVAASALPVLRYASLSGDTTAAGAGRRAVEYLSRLRLPRPSTAPGEEPGAPDLVTATQAAECFLLAYRMNGNREYLRAARYWADTGLPFVYLWSDKDRPATGFAAVPQLLPGEEAPRASAPVALDYARVLRALHLARPDPLYERVSAGILASAMRQQSTSGRTAGLLPEFWNVREGTPAGRMLHPWPLLEVMYRLEGLDADVSQARVRVGSDRMFVASGATIHAATTTATRLRLKLRWLRGQESVTTITGVPALPLRLEYNSDSLLPFGVAARPNYLPEGDPNAPGTWTYDLASGVLTVRLPHTGDDDHLEIRWPDPRDRAPVQPQDRAVKPRR